MESGQMTASQYLPDALRSRYALKLLGIFVLVGALVIGLGAVTALQVSERVTEDQLQNAELEANELADWFEGEQEPIRALSAHQGIDPDHPSPTAETLETELDERSAELAALHVTERADDEVRGYYSVPSEGVNWVVVKGIPR